jgi:uncharacterized protein
MTLYLDANIVIYLVEKHPIQRPKAVARLTAAQAAGDTLTISDLTRMECQVGPLKSGNAVLLAEFNAFFRLPTVTVLNLTPAVFDRAAHVRAVHGFNALDSLHLASAVEYSCGIFLTNDVQLARFPDIRVEILS